MYKMDNGEMRASSFPPNWGLGILILYFYGQQSIPPTHTILYFCVEYLSLWSIGSEKLYLTYLNN